MDKRSYVALSNRGVIKTNTISKYMKKWLKDNYSGIIVGAVIAVFGIWLQGKISDIRQENIRKSLTPIIQVVFYEASDNEIGLTFQSVNKKSSKIDKLFLKFDIPGTYEGNTVLNQDQINEVIIKSNFLSGNGRETTAETITIECSSIYSSGSFNVRIKYNPTGYYVDLILGYLVSITEQILDLHDFSPFYFYWTYNGTTITERGDFDLEHINYIKKDNQQLITRVSLLKRSINDQLNKSPDSPLSKYLLGLDLSESEEIIIPVINNPISIDTLIIWNDTITTKSVHRGLYNNYKKVREMEVKRRSWY